MMEQQREQDRKPSDEEILQYIMEADELSMPPEEIASIIENFFVAVDKFDHKESKINKICWYNSEVLGGWITDCWNEEGTRRLDYQKDDETALALIIEILSKVNQDTLKLALEKEQWSDKGYVVTIKEKFKSIERQQ